MADKLAIWKQALIHLEKATIVTLTDDVEAVYVFADAWEGVVEEAFNEGDWNFAKASAAMSLDGSVTPAIGWSYVFDYPADYMRTVAVSNVPDFYQPFTDWVDENGYLHANQNVMYIRYISKAKMADNKIALWPTMFWRYVALKLAFDTCGKLTSGTTKEQELSQRLSKALRQAKSVDARNENGKRPMPGSWLRARRGGYGCSGNGLGNIVVGEQIQLEEGDV